MFRPQPPFAETDSEAFLGVQFDFSLIFVPQDPEIPKKRSWSKDAIIPHGIRSFDPAKKFASDLMFLLSIPYDLSGCIVVLSVVSVSNHLSVLSKMFPCTQFFVYAVEKSQVEENATFHVQFNGFNDAIAASWRSSAKKVIFICDRYVGTPGRFGEPSHTIDMETQARWVRKMMPDKWFVKFRMPSRVIEANTPFYYMPGYLVYQPFCRGNVMDLRYFGSAANAVATCRPITYDPRTLEETMHRHNMDDRPNFFAYPNVYTGDYTPYSTLGLDNGYDTTYFQYAIYWYQTITANCALKSPKQMEEEGLALTADIVKKIGTLPWKIETRNTVPALVKVDFTPPPTLTLTPALASAPALAQAPKPDGVARRPRIWPVRRTAPAASPAV